VGRRPGRGVCRRTIAGRRYNCEYRRNGTVNLFAYIQVLGRPPAEADLQRHFRVTPPPVHQIQLTLERAGPSADSRQSLAASSCSSGLKRCQSYAPQKVKPSNPLCGAASRALH